MDVQDLETVLAVYNYKSWTEASYQTLQSLPNVSKRVSKVEKELGIRIFERRVKSLNTILTTFGEAVIPYIAHMMDMYAQISDYADETAFGKYELTVGYSPLIGTIGENEILSRFRSAEPDTAVSYRLRQREELIKLLAQGSLDCIFMMTYEDNRGLFNAFESMLDREIAIVPIMKLDHQYIGISTDHPLSSRSSVDISELENEIFVFSNTHEFGSVEDGYIKYTFIDSSITDFQSHLRYMDFIDSETVLNYVASGYGVIPLNCMPPANARGVKFLKLYGAGRGSMAFFIYRKDRHSKALDTLLKYVESYAEGGGALNGSD